MTKALLGKYAHQLSDFVNNNAPKLGSGTPPDQSYFLLGQEIAFDLPDNLFTDPDNDTLSITVSGLPAGLGYTAGQGVAGFPAAQSLGGQLAGAERPIPPACQPAAISKSTSIPLSRPMADETVLGSSGNDQLVAAAARIIFSLREKITAMM